MKVIVWSNFTVAFAVCRIFFISRIFEYFYNTVKTRQIDGTQDKFMKVIVIIYMLIKVLFIMKLFYNVYIVKHSSLFGRIFILWITEKIRLIINRKAFIGLKSD